MVSVDTVYQRVLALANKEQRGYIPPVKFNLFANQAQMEIFEQYFYDINQFKKLPGNLTEYSDVVDMLEEKIAAFETVSTTFFIPVAFVIFSIVSPKPLDFLNCDKFILFNFLVLQPPFY